MENAIDYEEYHSSIDVTCINRRKFSTNLEV